MMDAVDAATTSTACTSTTTSTRTRRRGRTSTTRPRFAAVRRRASPTRRDWRRDNIDTLVREMDERIQALKPWVKFGISPFGIWRNTATDPAGSRHQRHCRPTTPSTPTPGNGSRRAGSTTSCRSCTGTSASRRPTTRSCVPWWADVVAGTGVQLYIGQADYRIGNAGAWSDPGELDRQFALDRRYGVLGTVHYSGVSIRDDKLGAVTRYSDKYYGTPALPPTMARLPVARPGGAGGDRGAGQGRRHHGDVAAGRRPGRDLVRGLPAGPGRRDGAARRLGASEVLCGQRWRRPGRGTA